MLTATDDSGQVVGFCAAGPAADTSGGDGEVVVLNIDPSAWGHGHGQALLGAAIQHLVDEGFEDALLWVHPDNARARRLYEAAGWTCEGVGRTATVHGIAVPQVRYRRSLRPARRRLLDDERAGHPGVQRAVKRVGPARQ